jgi:hypothetical protein
MDKGKYLYTNPVFRRVTNKWRSSEFEVPMALIMNGTVFWVVVPHTMKTASNCMALQSRRLYSSS